MILGSPRWYGKQHSLVLSFRFSIVRSEEVSLARVSVEHTGRVAHARALVIRFVGSLIPLPVAAAAAEAAAIVVVVTADELSSLPFPLPSFAHSFTVFLLHRARDERSTSRTRKTVFTRENKERPSDEHNTVRAEGGITYSPPDG